MPVDQWDEYIQRVIDPQDKVLFEEAARAARASALRASYITVWLACAESLKRKFKDAAPCDNVATEVVSKIEDKEGNQQAIDGFVLARAREYGFISKAELDQLDSVYKQRCIYGHPYEQAPLLEQLLAAAATVVEFVLSRPTKLRHGYLARQVDLVCQDRTFLDDHFGAIERYAHIVHTRSSDDVHLWFLQKLWKGACALASDPSMEFFMRRITWFSTAFLRRCDNDFFVEWDVVQDLTEYPFVSSSVGHPDLFCRIGEHPQDIVVGKVLAEARSRAVSLRTVEALHNAGVLTQRQQERVLATIKELPPCIVASSGIHPEFYADRLIESLKSRDWYEQNPVIDAIRIIGPSGVARLTPEKQREFGNNVLQAADGNAKNAISFLTELSYGKQQWPEALVEGIIAECLVNDDDSFRFKIQYAREAVLALRSIPTEARAGVIRRIVSRLKRSTRKRIWNASKEQSQFVGMIQEVTESDRSVFGALAVLGNAVAELEMPDNE